MAATAMSVETNTEAVASNSTVGSVSSSQTEEAESIVKDNKTDNATPSVNISVVKGNLNLKDRSSLNIKRTSNNNVVSKVDILVPRERKETVSMNSLGSNSYKTNSQNKVIGAKLNFGLEQNSLLNKSYEDKQKNVGQSQKPKQNNSLLMTKHVVISGNKSKAFPSPEKAPHTTESLLESAVNIVNDCKLPKSLTCPKPEFVNHSDAVTLNCTSGDQNVGHRTLKRSAGAETPLPVERELQVLNSKDASREREGLCNRNGGSLSRNYGSVDISDTTPSASSLTSSPEEESGIVSSTSDRQEDVNGLAITGSSAPLEPSQEEHKKKKKRKKKKKGAVEPDQATASTSDHENKVTSPGTSGGEDIVKNKNSDTRSQTVPHTLQKNLTPLNGPNAPVTKLSTGQNKTKRSEIAHKTEDSRTGKHADNLQDKDMSDTAADEAKIVEKSDGASVKIVKTDQPELLDNSGKVDALRTGQTRNKVIRNEKLSVTKPKTEDVESEHVIYCDKELGKASSDRSVEMNKEKVLNMEFNQDDDDSNENEWRSAPRRTKRRATTLEDKSGSAYNNRPSQTDNFRRMYGSDYRLRKSSSEPSGMSRLMEESQGSYRHRHSFASRSQAQRDDYHSCGRRVETVPANESVEKPSVPQLQNTYAAKLKAKPPAAPNGNGKKILGQENQYSCVDQREIQIKQELIKRAEDDGTVAISAPPVGDDWEQRQICQVKQISDNAAKSRDINNSTSTAFVRNTSSSQIVGVGSDNVIVRRRGVSATTAAKSASLPRDLGRMPCTKVPKARLDNTSADNVVQYLDLQCSNDTYAARLKQSINSKPADGVAKQTNSGAKNKIDRSQPAERAKPPRTSRLESSHKAVSLDSATPVTTVMPKKMSNASGKDKDSIRSVKSETSLNMTSTEGSSVSQHNFFPFEAEPSASFDIMFGSVKFSESDFELIDEVVQSSQLKTESDSKPVPPPNPPNGPIGPTNRELSSPPLTNQVSCEELEKSWITRSPPNSANDNPNSKPKSNSARTSGKETAMPAPIVAASLAAILSSGNISSPSVAMNENNVKNLARTDSPNEDGEHAIESVFQKQQWYYRFNHVELAEMLLKDWQNFKSELANQTPKVVIYEED